MLAQRLTALSTLPLPSSPLSVSPVVRRYRARTDSKASSVVQKHTLPASSSCLTQLRSSLKGCRLPSRTASTTHSQHSQVKFHAQLRAGHVRVMASASAQTDSGQASSMDSKPPLRVVIAGAGPAGLLLAQLLLQRNTSGRERFEVTLCEARGDPRDLPPEMVKRFGLGLSARAQSAMSSVEGLWDAIVRDSGVRLSRFNTLQPDGSLKGPPTRLTNCLVDRVALSKTMLNALLQRHPQADIRFNWRLKSVDFSTRTALFSTASGNEAEESLRYDLLVGADGVRSAVRQAMADAGVECRVRDLNANWKALHIPRKPDPPLNESCAVRIPYKEPAVEVVKGYPSQASLNLIPCQDGTYILLCFTSPWTEPLALWRKSPSELRDWFNARVPFLSMTEREAAAVLESKASPTLEVTCGAYHHASGRALLAGDAAHAMSSALSMGCNTALLDVAAIARLLDEHEDDVEEVLSSYSRERVPEGRAAAAISLAGFPQQKWVGALFVAYTLITTALYKVAPSVAPQPIFDMLFQTDKPFAQVLSSHRLWFALIMRANGGYIRRAEEAWKATMATAESREARDAKEAKSA
eukprot:jgi/Chlat1/6855/Chrsp51S06532